MNRLFMGTISFLQKIGRSRFITGFIAVYREKYIAERVDVNMYREAFQSPII